MTPAPASAAPPGRRRLRRRRRALGTAVRIGVAILVGVAIGLGVVLVAGGREEAGESLTPATARAGQCVDVAEEAEGIDITAVPCGIAHDAEIVLTTRFREAFAEPAELDDAEGVCRGLMDPADVERLAEYDGDLTWDLLIDEPDNVDDFDRLVCYVRDPDGVLVGPLLD